jgi:hypothetical protein
MKFEDWVTPDMLFYRTSVEIEYMKEAWEASRENQQEYQKHEFCRSVKCLDFRNGKCWAQVDEDCLMTAKEFHHWLKENGFKVVKPQ